MGDHRSASGDSLEHWERTGDITEATITQKSIVGRAFTIFWPVSRASWLSVPKGFDSIPDAAPAKQAAVPAGAVERSTTGAIG